eukprot:Rhum_TRINITY_DN9016_c0_g2::Rhum_TRINITY_DN9016_c0_g2_i1::g.31148::m.31148
MGSILFVLSPEHINRSHLGSHPLLLTPAVNVENVARRTFHETPTGWKWKRHDVRWLRPVLPTQLFEQQFLVASVLLQCGTHARQLRLVVLLIEVAQPPVVLRVDLKGAARRLARRLHAAGALVTRLPDQRRQVRDNVVARLPGGFPRHGARRSSTRRRRCVGTRRSGGALRLGRPTQMLLACGLRLCAFLLLRLRLLVVFTRLLHLLELLQQLVGVGVALVDDGGVDVLADLGLPRILVGQEGLALLELRDVLLRAEGPLEALRVLRVRQRRDDEGCDARVRVDHFALVRQEVPQLLLQVARRVVVLAVGTLAHLSVQLRQACVELLHASHQRLCLLDLPLHAPRRRKVACPHRLLQRPVQVGDPLQETQLLGAGFDPVVILLSAAGAK